MNQTETNFYGIGSDHAEFIFKKEISTQTWKSPHPNEKCGAEATWLQRPSVQYWLLHKVKSITEVVSSLSNNQANWMSILNRKLKETVSW